MPSTQKRYRQLLFWALRTPWMPRKPWLRTLVWKQERRHLLRKAERAYQTRPYDQQLMHSMLRMLTYRKHVLQGLSQRHKKQWFRRLRRLQARADISLSNQALAIALMLDLGRSFMTKGRFAQLDLNAVIDEVDEAVLLDYLASRRTPRRIKKQALTALLNLSDQDRLAAILLRSKKTDRWFSKNSWLFGKSAYYDLLEAHLQWGHRLSRAARMALLPDILAGEVDTLRTAKTFMDEDHDPLLTTLMFAEMTKAGVLDYSQQNAAFWSQYPILKQADAALQERRHTLQRPFWSRRDSR